MSSLATKEQLSSLGEPAPEKEIQKDRGLRCWLQVIGCFASWTNTFGLVNAYGEFQTYYESTLDQPPGNIAWIGSEYSRSITGRLIAMVML